MAGLPGVLRFPAHARPCAAAGHAPATAACRAAANSLATTVAPVPRCRLGGLVWFADQSRTLWKGNGYRPQLGVQVPNPLLEVAKQLGYDKKKACWQALQQALAAPKVRPALLRAYLALVPVH